MKKEELNRGTIGAQIKADKVGYISGSLSCRPLKSHSIIALNLQTVEDVEQVIRQCEALKEQMQDGLDSRFDISQNGYIRTNF